MKSEPITGRLDQSQEKSQPDPHSHIDKLKHLLEMSWSAYDGLHDQPFIVRPAIPILVFGDSDRYYASPVRVVTVGLNPSSAEFPEDDRFRRFPAARELATNSNRRDPALHLEALNAYFRTDEAYRQWFASFEHVLAGIGTSYYGGANTALHTDLCSPIATAPTWSNLRKDQKSLLHADGLQIWHSLIETLAPDIIVISLAKQHLEKISFRNLTPSQVILTIDRENPYLVWGRLLMIKSPKPTLMAFGRAANTPFGTVSNTKKLEIGAAIRESFNASER